MNRAYRDLFKGTAWYYARYRYCYPQVFIEYLVQRLGLQGQGRMLDLGCGTGQLALPLARYFQQVIGLDPELEMLAEARRLANEAGLTNIEWLAGGSEDLADLKAELGKYRLVTMGSSFHWMNQEATLLQLDHMIEPAGGVVLVSIGDPFKLENELDVAWQAAVQALIRKWLGATRRAGSGTYRQPPLSFEEVLARSPFKRFELYELDDVRHLTLDEIIGTIYSTSYASKAVLGDRQGPFEQDVRETLLRLNPVGNFSEKLQLGAYLAFKD
jgi:ubiquinone/menaquinone biosynthesis C-methylase UbiE